MNEIIVAGLTKDYGKGKGIFDINFTVEQGEVFGFLGPNGAGKTTTIRNLMGFLTPDDGKCSIGGLDCFTKRDEIQKRLGYLPGEITFFEHMKGNEFLKFMADMRSLRDFKKMHELIKYFELDTSGKIKKMSKGMKQKIAIICAFMHSPDILVLDEPTSGLDPLMQSKFIELVQKEKARGTTIFMSSHSFEEVERTADRVGIIKNGKFVAIKPVHELKAMQRKMYSVTLKNEDIAAAFAAEELDVMSVKDNTVNVSVKGDLKPFTSALARYDVMDIGVVMQNLEEIFMAYYGGKNDD